MKKKSTKKKKIDEKILYPAVLELISLGAKAKVVKYKITDTFGDRKIGSIIPAILIAKEGHRGLLYHPRLDYEYECSSFELCEYEPHKRVWVARSDNSYINTE